MEIINKYYKFLLLFSILLITSCEFNSTNSDPDRLQSSSITPNAIIPVMQTQTHRNLTAVLGRFSGIIAQQWIGFDAQQVAYTSYVIGEADADNPWNTGLYVGSLRDCADLIARTTKTKNLKSRGLAKIYLAVNLGVATNIWGDVPYSSAFLGSKNLTPSYDSQESIYENIINLLEEAEEDINSGIGNFDGDLTEATSERWIKTAKTLKARFYLHLIKRDENAAAKALIEISEGALNANEDQINFNFGNSINAGNPLAIFGTQRPNTIVIDPQFEKVMDGDPRKNLYMVKDEKDFLYYDGSLFWSNLDSPVPLISYWEAKFIEAEALVRTGQNGESALKDAVRANMEYLVIPKNEIDIYIGTINLNEKDSDMAIEIIINEKYKALYGNAPIEVWNDYRRTGFPSLIPNKNGKNGLNPSGIVPRRLLYPNSERISNLVEYQRAIKNQGGHLLDNDTWIWPSN